MTKQEIIDFLRANQASFLATVENGEPRVRGMAHIITDDGDIVYQTGVMKDVGVQLAEGAPVELCAFDPATMVQIRVRGKAQRFEDQALMEKIMEDRPFLKPIAEAMGLQAFLLVRVVNAKANVWTMATNMQPMEWMDL